MQQQIRELDDLLQKNRDKKKKLEAEFKGIKSILKLYAQQEIKIISQQELEELVGIKKIEEKTGIYQKLKNTLEKQIDETKREEIMIGLEISAFDKEIEDLQIRLRDLENRKLQFPKTTVLLKEAIEKEFHKRGISSKVYILAELLEIRDMDWANAVEGYLNTQKFNLIVEPEHFNIALQVYHKNREQISTTCLSCST